MPTNTSPFRAGFGKVPPTLAGRDSLIESFRSAIEVGTWSQERALLLRGFRGVGKTVTVETLRRIAEDEGWTSINETASPGFLGRLENQLRRHIRQLDPPAARRLRSVTIAPVGGLEFDTVDAVELISTFETLVHELAELIEPAGGLLITVDEVNKATIEEFRVLTGALQRVISSDREVAIVAAGLHSEMAAVFKDRSSTFLRRAVPENLDLLTFEDTIQAIREPIDLHGRFISDEAVNYAAAAAQGYPFLTQLIGDFAWKAHPAQHEITLDDVRHAARLAKRRMGANVHEPSISDLSSTDRTVLVAMAQDDGPSRVGDLRARMDVDAKFIGVYRARLIGAGLIYAAGHGAVDFALPYLREYLREHTVTDAMSATNSEIARARREFPPPPDDL